VITLTSFSFWLNFVYFFVVFFVVFFIPGSVILKRFKFSLFQHIVLSSVVGITLWALQAFIFGFLGFRNFSYIYLILFILIWIRINGDLVKRNKWKINPQKLDYLTFLILIIGSIVQFYPIFFNGLEYSSGVYFCCAGKDGLYHISLTNELIKRFPPYEPAMFGEIVRNYHYLANLVLAEMIRVFKLPLIYLQMQYFPLILSFLIGLSVLVFSQIAGFSKRIIFLTLFFIYFFADITPIFMFLLGNGLRFDVPIISNLTFWASPPRLFAIPVFFAGLSFLALWLKKNTLSFGLLSAVLFASLIGFKIYFGLFAVIGYFFLFIWFLLKKEYKKILPILIFVLVSSMLFFAVNQGVGGLIFTYFWRFENFISQPGFNLTKLELERGVYAAHNNYLRLAEYELLYILAYFIFAFGFLNLAFIQTKKTLANFQKGINLFLIPASLISLFIGFFFIQKTGGANTSQFIITAAIIGSFYAAFAIDVIFKRVNRKIGLVIVFIILSITSLRAMHDSRAIAKGIVKEDTGFFINSDEISAFKYLKYNSEQNVIILTYPKTEPRWKCFYVNFQAERNLFLCDAEGILSDHGVDVSSRLNSVNKIFYSPDPNEVQKAIEINNISYLYLPIDKSPFATASANFLIPVFQNSSVKILKFIPNNDTINL